MELLCYKRPGVMLWVKLIKWVADSFQKGEAALDSTEAVLKSLKAYMCDYEWYFLEVKDKFPKRTQTSDGSEGPQKMFSIVIDGKGLNFHVWFPHLHSLWNRDEIRGFLSFGMYAEEDARVVSVAQKTCVVWELYPSYYYCCLSSLWESLLYVSCDWDVPNTKYCKFCEGVDHAFRLLLGC